MFIVGSDYLFVSIIPETNRPLGNFDPHFDKVSKMDFKELKCVSKQSTYMEWYSRKIDGFTFVNSFQQEYVNQLPYGIIGKGVCCHKAVMIPTEELHAIKYPLTLVSWYLDTSAMIMNDASIYSNRRESYSLFYTNLMDKISKDWYAIINQNNLKHSVFKRNLPSTVTYAQGYYRLFNTSNLAMIGTYRTEEELRAKKAAFDN